MIVYEQLEKQRTVLISFAEMTVRKSKSKNCASTIKQSKTLSPQNTQATVDVKEGLDLEVNGNNTGVSNI